MLFFCLFNCKQSQKDNVKEEMLESINDTSINNIQETALTKENNENILDIGKSTQIDCIGGIYFDNVIPTFNFEKEQSSSRKSFLMDTLFRSFHKNRIEMNIDKSLRGYFNYIEFSQVYIPDNENFFTDKENKFLFYIGVTKHLKPGKERFALEKAEINFPTKHYRNANRELFKIKKDTKLIDIGISKKEFAKIFNKETNKLCDTVYVGNETDTSYYIFKNSKLAKVIFNFYTP